MRVSQYFPKPYEHSGGNVKVELDLCNYSTKAYPKGATDDDTCMLASKTSLAALKTKLPNLYVDKLNTVPDSGKQRLEKKNEDIDKNIPNTTGQVKKTDCNIKRTETENKTLIVTGFVITAALNTKATEIENKILDVINLTPKAAPNAKLAEVEFKILGISNLATKAALKTKPSEIENKISDTS